MSDPQVICDNCKCKMKRKSWNSHKKQKCTPGYHSTVCPECHLEFKTKIDRNRHFKKVHGQALSEIKVNPTTFSSAIVNPNPLPANPLPAYPLPAVTNPLSANPLPAVRNPLPAVSKTLHTPPGRKDEIVFSASESEHEEQSEHEAESEEESEEESESEDERCVLCNSILVFRRQCQPCKWRLDDILSDKPEPKDDRPIVCYKCNRQAMEWKRGKGCCMNHYYSSADESSSESSSDSEKEEYMNNNGFQSDDDNENERRTYFGDGSQSDDDNGAFMDFDEPQPDEDSVEKDNYRSSSNSTQRQVSPLPSLPASPVPSLPASPVPSLPASPVPSLPASPISDQGDILPLPVPDEEMRQLAKVVRKNLIICYKKHIPANSTWYKRKHTSVEDMEILLDKFARYYSLEPTINCFIPSFKLIEALKETQNNRQLRECLEKFGVLNMECPEQMFYVIKSGRYWQLIEVLFQQKEILFHCSMDKNPKPEDFAGLHMLSLKVFKIRSDEFNVQVLRRLPKQSKRYDTAAFTICNLFHRIHRYRLLYNVKIRRELRSICYLISSSFNTESNNPASFVLCFAPMLFNPTGPDDENSEEEDDSEFEDTDDDRDDEVERLGGLGTFLPSPDMLNPYSNFAVSTDDDATEFINLSSAAERLEKSQYEPMSGIPNTKLKLGNIKLIIGDQDFVRADYDRMKITVDIDAISTSTKVFRPICGVTFNPLINVEFSTRKNDGVNEIFPNAQIARFTTFAGVNFQVNVWFPNLRHNVTDAIADEFHDLVIRDALAETAELMDSQHAFLEDAKSYRLVKSNANGSTGVASKYSIPLPPPGNLFSFILERAKETQGNHYDFSGAFYVVQALGTKTVLKSKSTQKTDLEALKLKLERVLKVYGGSLDNTHVDLAMEIKPNNDEVISVWNLNYLKNYLSFFGFCKSSVSIQNWNLLDEVGGVRATFKNNDCLKFVQFYMLDKIPTYNPNQTGLKAFSIDDMLQNNSHFSERIQGIKHVWNSHRCNKYGLRVEWRINSIYCSELLEDIHNNHKNLVIPCTSFYNLKSEVVLNWKMTMLDSYLNQLRLLRQNIELNKGQKMFVGKYLQMAIRGLISQLNPKWFQILNKKLGIKTSMVKHGWLTNTQIDWKSLKVTTSCPLNNQPKAFIKLQASILAELNKRVDDSSIPKNKVGLLSDKELNDILNEKLVRRLQEEVEPEQEIGNIAVDPFATPMPAFTIVSLFIKGVMEGIRSQTVQNRRIIGNTEYLDYPYLCDEVLVNYRRQEIFHGESDWQTRMGWFFGKVQEVDIQNTARKELIPFFKTLREFQSRASFNHFKQLENQIHEMIRVMPQGTQKRRLWDYRNTDNGRTYKVVGRRTWERFVINPEDYGRRRNVITVREIGPSSVILSPSSVSIATSSIIPTSTRQSPDLTSDFSHSTPIGRTRRRREPFNTLSDDDDLFDLEIIPGKRQRIGEDGLDDIDFENDVAVEERRSRAQGLCNFEDVSDEETTDED